MNILHKDITTITFDDVVGFCEERNIESVQLDYKKDKPRDLSKHFAAFSNTLGGLIIIGVEEDEKTGLPKAWEGIKNDDKHTDWVHQKAAAVIPLPSYEVTLTDEKNGKVFLLIRIFEGPASPYMTQSDPTTPWLRTGNISTPLKTANREDILQLFSKSSRAQSTRETVADLEELHFKGLLEVQVEEWRRDQINGKAQTELPPGEKTMLLRTNIMPYDPSRSLFTPQDAYGSQLADYIGQRSFNRISSLTTEAVPIPGGLAKLKHTFVGGIHAFQFYADGSIRMTNDVSTFDKATDIPYIHAEAILSYILLTLTMAKSVYKKVNYQGQIEGDVSLADCKNAVIVGIDPEGSWSSMEDWPTAPFNCYTWKISLDTSILNDSEEFKEYMTTLGLRIQWDLGITTPNINDGMQSWISKNQF